MVNNATFYLDAMLTTPKFVLPYSYCVKIVNYGAEYSKVVYMDDSPNYPKIEGFVSNSYLKPLTAPINNFYPNIKLRLSCDGVIFGDLDNTNPLSVITKDSLCYYYGSITYNGEEFLYVYANGQIGYINKNLVDSFTLPQNQVFLDIDDSSDSFSSVIDSQNQNEPYKVSEIIIIVAICLLGLCLVFYIIKPNKNIENNKFFDE